MLLHVACFTDSANHGVHGGFGPDVVGDVVTAVADGFDTGQEVGFANGAEFTGEPLHVGVDGAHLGVGSDHEGVTVDSDEVDKLGIEGVADSAGFAPFLEFFQFFDLAGAAPEGFVGAASFGSHAEGGAEFF